MTGVIRTVCGDIDPAMAGVVDSHDHLFLSTPVLPGEELDDENAAAAEIRAFSAAGGGTVVQWTPRGLGRNLSALTRLSESSAVAVVAATGRHRRAVYAQDSAEFTVTVDELSDAFISDIAERACGLIKIGVSYETIYAGEMDAILAAARAHHATGAPIAVHLERGSAAGLVLHALRSEAVPEQSIVIGHLGRNPDAAAIVDAAQSGAWLCLDAPSPRHPLELDRFVSIFSTLIDSGHVSQILLGADTTSSSDWPAFGPASLMRGVVPQLERALGSGAIFQILVDNPARAWAWQPKGITSTRPCVRRGE